MILALLHSGDLSIWQTLLILAFLPLMIIIFVALPLGLVGYTICKIARNRLERAGSE